MDLQNQAIVRALYVHAKAETALKQAIKDAQLSCDHASLAEAEVPNQRICLKCGITEHAYATYLVLKHDSELGLPRIPTTLLYKLRRGLIINSENKGPLLRKEVDLASLIRDY